MTTFILIIHIVLAIAIIGLVLLQRGTGGGLGLGESGGMGGFATPRSAANILTKATTWCALLFFATSLSLAVLASHKNKSGVLEELQSLPGTPATTSTGTLKTEETPAAPEVPVPAATPEVPASP